MQFVFGRNISEERNYKSVADVQVEVERWHTNVLKKTAAATKEVRLRPI